MKSKLRALALLLGGALALSAFAACAPKTGDGGGNEDGNDGENGNGAGDSARDVRICYDNLGGGYLDASLTTAAVAGATVVKGYNAAGIEVSSASSIATYENGVFTAVSEGTVVYRSAQGELGTVEVVPAYVTDPGNQYAGGLADFSETGLEGEKVLGRTHDPSLIEVKDDSGLSVYYMFSTGWADRSPYLSGTTGETISTYGNAIHVSYDGMKTWSFLGRTFNYATRDEDFVDARSGQWLYKEGVTPQDTAYPGVGGSDSSYSSASASWWAPDIVTKPDGSGYWLYTCVVDGSGDHSGMLIQGKYYARACILLYESETLEPGSFKPVLDANGDPVVFMQSTIERDEGVLDINGIDPQIIYDTEGNMYMAYGSFGSGNYMLELDPATGLRKDGKGWQTHSDIRNWIVNDIQTLYAGTAQEGSNLVDGKSIGWKHDYYGTNISKAAMEAPVIARHDNVTTMDAEGNILEENKTYYYSMHSYDGLADNYQMWGGRSESVWGVYKSTTGGIVYNASTNYPAIPSANSEGNKYIGSFQWHDVSSTSTERAVMLPGHNDLFTTSSGTSVAAFISRQAGRTGNFVTRVHQYYLNSYGEIVINPNRYSGEADRPVTAEELFAYTDGGKFKMVVMSNAQRDNTNTTEDDKEPLNTSRDVVLTQNASDKNSGTITDGGTAIGTWKMYGNGYIQFIFSETLKGTGGRDSGDTVYYGVVRPAWLGDQNKSGFTITCLGQTEGNKRSMSMFMNNYSTITGTGLVG